MKEGDRVIFCDPVLGRRVFGTILSVASGVLRVRAEAETPSRPYMTEADRLLTELVLATEELDNADDKIDREFWLAVVRFLEDKLDKVNDTLSNTLAHLKKGGVDWKAVLS